MKLRPGPQKARHDVNAKEAWFYENERTLEVYIETEEKFVVSCHLPRRAIAAWVQRTEKEPT